MLREAFFPRGKPTQDDADDLEDEFDFDTIELPTLQKG